MKILPDFSDFAKIHADGQGAAQVVWTTLVSDLETPVSAMLKLTHGKPHSFLLESVEGGAARGHTRWRQAPPEAPTQEADGSAAAPSGSR